MSLSQKIADLKALLPRIQDPYRIRLEWMARRLEIWKRRALRKGARLAALELCEQELIRAGWTYQPGAPHWKPPVNEEMGNMHRRVFQLEAELAALQSEQPAPMSAEAPLSGEWRASQFYVCCGTLRIFRIDIDTDPSAEFTDSLMRWVVERLNAPSDSQQDAEECALCKQYAEENTEQAAEIARLRHDFADERRRWPECDKHRAGEPDARRGHCAQCGVEREKSKDAEIRRLKSLAKEIANDLTEDAVSLNTARKDLADAKATIAELREELIRSQANSETLRRMMADTVGIAEMRDRIATLESEKANIERRLQLVTDDLVRQKQKRGESEEAYQELEAEKAALEKERAEANEAACSYKAQLAKDNLEWSKCTTERDTFRERVRGLEEDSPKSAICEKCHGSGLVNHENNVCYSCDGAGVVCTLTKEEGAK